MYTFVTNKAGKGKKGSLVASIKGTRANEIVSVLEKFSETKRLQVKEVTLDMGSKLTKELSDFLKETGRYTGRYD